jgi:preprotein translocase subunit YajC
VSHSIDFHLLAQNVLAQNNAEGGGSILSLLIILIPMGAILYMTVIPQRKQRQRHAEMLRKIDVGDEVLTTGGILGVITHVEDDVYHVEIDTDVVIRISKGAIARNMAEPDPSVKPARGGLMGGLTGAPKQDADAEDGAADGQ